MGVGALTGPGAGAREETYTKSDVMATLNALKTPTEFEARRCREMTGADDGANGTEAVALALAGAEALADALLDGLDAEPARKRLTDGAAKAILERMLRDAEGALSRLADLLGEP